MFMRKIIDWCDGHGIIGAFVEGFCEGALVSYFPLVVACFIYQRKLNEK